jgi:alpha-beta hydrolase superfamily lysophospholipase
MDCEEQKDSYYKYAIPESKLVVRDTITRAARVDFKADRPPLLLTAGTEDHAIPSSLNHANYKRYAKSRSITEFKEFAGRNHFVLGQSTWKEDADFILKWINKF